MIEPLSDEIVSKRCELLYDVLTDLSFELKVETVNYVLETAAVNLAAVYSDGYRQMYSELYEMLVNLSDGDLYNLMPLMENMESLRDHVRDTWFQDENLKDEDKRYPPYLYGCVLKLSDHLSLEYQRYSQSAELHEEIDLLMSLSIKLEIDLSSMTDESKEMKKSLTEAKKKQSKMQTENVMILAVFAAVVMAFSGGLNFLNSSLAGMENTNPFKMTFVILLCGFVMFNVISALMNSVNKIVLDLYEDEEEEETNVIGTLKKIWFKHTYIFAFNIVIIFLMAMDILLWYLS